NEAGNQQWFNATFDLYAELDATQAGVHMSRFSDALDEVMEGIDTTAWPKIEMLAEHIAKTIVEKQKAFRSEVHIHTASAATMDAGFRTSNAGGLWFDGTSRRY